MKGKNNEGGQAVNAGERTVVLFTDEEVKDLLFKVVKKIIPPPCRHKEINMETKLEDICLADNLGKVSIANSINLFHVLYEFETKLGLEISEDEIISLGASDLPPKKIQNLFKFIQSKYELRRN